MATRDVRVNAALMTTSTDTQSPSISTRSARLRRTAGAALSAAAAAVVMLPAGSAAASTPPKPRDTHCAAAFALTAVSTFVPPYDTFAQSLDTNGNGYVCMKPVTQAAANALDPRYGLLPGSPLYLVGDDRTARPQ